MWDRTRIGIDLLVFVVQPAGCGLGSLSTPSAPSSSVPQTPTLIAFRESASGFSTSDLRDVQEQIRHDTSVSISGDTGFDIQLVRR